MPNISPGVYSKIIDLSTFVQVVPGTIGLACAITKKGEDNVLKSLSMENQISLSTEKIMVRVLI